METINHLVPVIGAIASLIAAIAALVGVTGWRKTLRWDRVYNELTGAKRLVIKTQTVLKKWQYNIGFMCISNRKDRIILSREYRNELTNNTLFEFDQLYEAIVLLDSATSEKYPNQSESVLEAKEEFKYFAESINDALDSNPDGKIMKVAEGIYNSSQALRELSKYISKLNQNL